MYPADTTDKCTNLEEQYPLGGSLQLRRAGPLLYIILAFLHTPRPERRQLGRRAVPHLTRDTWTLIHAGRQGRLTSVYIRVNGLLSLRAHGDDGAWLPHTVQVLLDALQAVVLLLVQR